MDKKRQDWPYLLFLCLLFILLPLVNVRSIEDPSLVPRYLLTCISLSVFFFFRLFSSSGERPVHFLPVKILFLFCAQQIWMLISIASSINPGDAFQEWFRILSFSLFFCLAYMVLRETKQPLIFVVRASVFALLIFTYYGFLQLYPMVIDYIQKGKPILINLDLCSSVSNKNFFSEVLTLLLPFTMYGVRTEKGKWLAFSWTGLLLCLFWILLLQTVSSWLGILSGGMLMLLFSRITKTKTESNSVVMPVKRKILLGGISIAVIGITFFLYTKSNNYSYLVRKAEMAKMYWSKPDIFHTTSTENNNSVYERILVWKNSLHLIKEHPLFGAGLNNWKLLEAKYGIGGTAYLNTGIVHFEHPHNDYLLVWSEQGIPGIVGYLLFFYFILIEIYRSLKRMQDLEKRRMLLMASFAVGSFMVMSFFGYPRSRYYVMLLLMLWAAVVFYISGSSSEKFVWSKSRQRLVSILLFILATVSVYPAWSWLSGELHLRKAKANQLRKNYSAMTREISKAKNYFFRVDGTTTPLEWYDGLARFYQGDLEGARKSFEAAEKVNPYHLRVLNDLATCYEQSKMPEQAIEHYRLGLQITPLFVEGLLNLSASYFNIHQPDSALAVISKVPQVRMSYREEKNYKTYLTTILYAVASKDTVSIQDSVQRQAYMNYIANDTLLVNTFKTQKMQGKLFDRVLLKRFNSLQ